MRVQVATRPASYGRGLAPPLLSEERAALALARGALQRTGSRA